MKKFIQILLLVLLCGCEIFSLREADPPNKPPLWNNFYTTWELTRQNLEYSYEDERNLVNYGGLFSSNFQFYFSQQDITDYNITEVWTRNNEIDMLYNLQSMADSINVELELIPDQADDVQSSPVKLYRNYTLKVKKNSVVETYAGKMELQMVQDEDGYWRIIKWYDYRSSTPMIYPTWGKLKNEYSV